MQGKNKKKQPQASWEEFDCDLHWNSLLLCILTLIHYYIWQPAWDVSERSHSDLHWDRYLRDLSEASQKRCLFCDVFKRSQAYLKKDVFSVTSETSQKYLLQVFLVFRKYFTKMIWCDFRRLIISDKIDVGPSETFKKWNFLWEQYIDISQVCPVGWYLRESFGKSRIVKTQYCFTYYCQWFFSTDKTLYNLLSL